MRQRRVSAMLSVVTGRPRRFAAAILAVFTVVVVAAAGASGATTGTVTHRQAAAPATTQPAPTVNESWALTPLGTDPNQPGNRPTFSYNLAPGESQNDGLTVWNYGDTQLTFHIYATDAFNTKDGGFDLLTDQQKAKDVGSWITIEQNNLTLPPRSKANLKLHISVPANATPGDHSAGIVAASTTPGISAEGKHLILDRRVGSRVYLRVAGPTNPALTIENLSSDYQPAINPLGGSLDVTYTVRNAGNVRLGARQKITVKDLFGTVTDRRPASLPEVLPGNAVTITQHFTGVAATLRVGADVAVTPFIPKASGVAVAGPLATASSSTKTWAIPWLLVGILIALIALIVYSRRRRERAGGGTGGSAVTPIDDGPASAGPTAAPAEPVGAPMHRTSTPPGGVLGP
jgi:hypothetical protein